MAICDRNVLRGLDRGSSRVLKNPLEVRTVTAKRAKPALGPAEGEAGDRQVDWGKMN
jgi:hypothetical protein